MNVHRARLSRRVVLYSLKTIALGERTVLESRLVFNHFTYYALDQTIMPSVSLRH